MDKLAQDRGLLNKLREKVNLSGKVLERLNPEFQEIMEKLRATDEKIRGYAGDLKTTARSAKSYVNRRDYLAAAKQMSAFHERCRYISAEFQKFISGVDMKHYKFLLDQFDEDQKQQLFGYDPTKEINLEEENSADDHIITASLKKEAGLSDWWFKMVDPIEDLYHNVATERGRAMRALEKKFSISFLKQLKVSSNVMVDRTIRFLGYLLSAFKKLASALATRNLGQYVLIAKDFIKRFLSTDTGYHKSFVDYYNKNIVPLKEQYDKLQKSEEEQKSKTMEEDTLRKRQTVVPAPTNESVPELLSQQIKTPYGRKPFPSSQPQSFTPSSDVPLTKDDEELLYNKRPLPSPEPQSFTSSEPVPLTSKEEELPYEDDAFNLQRKKLNSQFLKKIEKLSSNNNPQKLVREILNYSAELEDISPQKSLELLSIAEGLIEDYKSAGVFDFLKPKEQAVEPKKQQEVARPFVQTPPEVSKPIDPGIPEGRLDKKYDQFPVLKSITPDKIRITQKTSSYISQVFVKRLFDLGEDVSSFEPDLENKIINALKFAIPNGLVINNYKSDDLHNPLDRQLEIYTYINLTNIDDEFKGVAKLKVLCRLSVFGQNAGILTIRNINKNFSVEE